MRGALQRHLDARWKLWRRAGLSLLFLCLLILSSTLSACTPKPLTKLPAQTRFAIVQSDILAGRAQLTALDERGKTLGENRLRLQDGSVSARAPGVFYVAGHRSNDNILIRGGDIQYFNLLDEPNYSGSTAVYLEDEANYACMNGNVSEETGYECLLVARDIRSGKTLYQSIVPLFATQILADENYLYLVGTNAGIDREEAVLTVVSKQTGKLLLTHIFPTYREIFSAALVQGRLLIVATDKADFKQKLLTVEGILTALEEQRLANTEDGLRIQPLLAWQDKKVDAVYAAPDGFYLWDQRQLYRCSPDGQVQATFSLQADEAVFWGVDLSSAFSGQKAERKTVVAKDAGGQKDKARTCLWLYSSQASSSNKMTLYMQELDARTLEQVKSYQVSLPRFDLVQVAALEP